jgi:hypothetical protein
MNQAIKMLEEIGQSQSLNQHSNLDEMLSYLNLNSGDIQQLKIASHDLVCGLVPEDDEDDK